jgi:peptide/nickel transport system substrate-binding protein
MENKNMIYAAVAVVAVIIIAYGGYTYMQGQSGDSELEARRARWEEWEKTLYMGTTSTDFHPGINMGTGYMNSLAKHLSGTKLFWVDRTNGDAYNPLVGESWELKQDADGLYYVEFTLKEGMEFRDGTPINAEAVKYCWEQELLEMPYREQHREAYHVYGHEVSWGTKSKGLFAIDETTFHMYTNPGWPNYPPVWLCFLFSLDHSFLYSPTSTEQWALEDNTVDDFMNQVGWGPAYLDEWVEGERIVMTRNDDYPVNPLGPEAGPSYMAGLEHVVISHYSDSASTRLALEKGEIDTTLGKGIARADTVDISANPDMNYVFVPGVSSQQNLHMNFGDEFAPLNDTRVRRAIQYLVEPEEIIDKLMFGTATIAHSPVRPFQFYFKPIMKPIRDLPEAERVQIAKDLLAEAGYPEGFTTQFWYPAGSGEEFSRDVGTILQAQLARAGITIELKFIERGTFYDMARAGELPMFLRGWTYDYYDPDTELFYQMHSTSVDLAKRIQHNVSEIDDMLEEARNTYMAAKGDGQYPSGDPAVEARREEIYTYLQDYIVEVGFSVPLYYDGFYDAHRTWVKDYKPWMTCDKPWMGVWQISKEIPDDWETRDPPI